MKLKELDSDLVVKVGCNEGAGYIYAGRFGDMDHEAITEKIYNDEWNAMLSSVKRVKACGVMANKAMLTHMLKRAKAIDTFVPIMEREIIEIYDSICEPGVKCVLVEGVTAGRAWLVDESDKPVNVSDTNGAYACVGWIYRQTALELISAMEGIFSDKPRANAQTAYRIAQSLSRNPYGALEDVNSVIDYARQVAASNISRRQKIPKWKVEETIKGALCGSF